MVVLRLVNLPLAGMQRHQQWVRGWRLRLLRVAGRAGLPHRPAMQQWLHWRGGCRRCWTCRSVGHIVLGPVYYDQWVTVVGQPSG